MGSLLDYITAGFGLGVGSHLAIVVFMLLGFIFFIPGYIMYQDAKKSGKVGGSSEIGGIVLMSLGVVIMGGWGFSYLIDGINGMINND
jgi:hypothetical protein